MSDPVHATHLAHQLARLRSLHATAGVRANHPPRLPEGAWIGPAAVNYEIAAEQLALSLRTARDLLGEARDDVARELAHALS